MRLRRHPATSALLLSFFLTTIPFTWAIEPEPFQDIDINDPTALQEATRILAEEVKLAARPQTYIILDLVEGTVVIKSRGIELHRFPIQQWSAIHLDNAAGTFRLQTRPPVTRRKIEPAAGTELPPISLDDMPTEFTLQFSPALSVTVHPTVSDDLWRWIRFKGREWWSWFKAWSLILTTGKGPPSDPSLHLTVTSLHAQSLAWTVTKDMPFLVRRTFSSSHSSSH